MSARQWTNWQGLAFGERSGLIDDQCIDSAEHFESSRKLATRSFFERGQSAAFRVDLEDSQELGKLGLAGALAHDTMRAQVLRLPVTTTPASCL